MFIYVSEGGGCLVSCGAWGSEDNLECQPSLSALFKMMSHVCSLCVGQASLPMKLWISCSLIVGPLEYRFMLLHLAFKTQAYTAYTLSTEPCPQARNSFLNPPNE